MKGKETMIRENTEITARGGKPAPPGSPPGPQVGPQVGLGAGPEFKIDLERLVWDPEYRDQVRRRLKRPG